MLCSRCHGEIPDQSMFCNHCGKKQTREQHSRTRGNGQGTVYKRGKTWTASVVVGKTEVDGKLKLIRPTKGGFATKKEALAYLDTLRERKTGKKQQVVTLDSLWNGYLKGPYKKLSKNKQTAYNRARDRLNDIFYRDITTLTIEDLQDCVDANAKTYYPAKDMKSVLSHCYQYAMAQGVVTINLSKFIVLPELNATETVPLSEAELNGLWDSYGKGDKIAGYALLMTYSGMMPGELFIATKDMIDWEKQYILGCGLKTKKRKQAPILVADFMMPVLQDLCDYSPSNKIWNGDDNKFYDEFKLLKSRCQLRDEITPYSCRHTTATALALGNIAPSIIQEVMRHSKITTTQKYIHINTARTLAAVNTLKKKKKQSHKKSTADTLLTNDDSKASETA